MITTSADNCFMRQYSCARSIWRMMSTSSGSSMRARMIGRSPEIPCAHSVEISSELRASTSAVGRSDGSTYRTAFARRWNSRASSEVMQRHLRRRPGQRVRAFEGAGIAIFIGEIQRLLARGRGNGGKNQMDSAAGRHAHRAAQAQDRVEHRTNRIGERAAIHHRYGIPQTAGASHKARAIRFKLQFSDRFGIRDQDVGDPHRGLLFGALPARGYQRADVWHEFGFDEEFRESRMSNVRCLRSERKFRIGSDLNVARAIAYVAERNAADFRVVFGRNDHFQSRGE